MANFDCGYNSRGVSLPLLVLACLYLLFADVYLRPMAFIKVSKQSRLVQVNPYSVQWCFEGPTECSCMSYAVGGRAN